MPIVKVFANSHVNPAHVGTVTVDVVMDDAVRTRTTRTRIFDATGQNLMLICETTVSTDSSVRGVMRAVKIDNEVHAEILAALREGRDALSYKAIDDRLEKEGDCA